MYKMSSIQEQLATLPDSSQNIVYADPPWTYKQTVKSGVLKRKDGSLIYPSMPIKELCALFPEIERVTNVRIRDIFELGGESHFREIEARTIETILDGPPVILSTGGGAFCQPGVRDLIKQKALSVWLDAPPEILLARIGNTASRPLLHGDNPLKILKSLAEDRNPHYAKADLTLKTDAIGLSHSVTKLAALVTAAIQQSESIDETE